MAVLDRVMGPNRERGQIIDQAKLVIALRDELIEAEADGFKRGLQRALVLAEVYGANDVARSIAVGINALMEKPDAE